MRIFNLFRRKRFKPQPKQLRIDGVKTVLTAAPDDAELAAQALLESRINTTHPQPSRGRETNRRVNHSPSGETERGYSGELERGSVAYYQQLSEKIRTAHEHDARMAMRYVAYCEAQITSAIRHQPSDISPQPSAISHQPSDIAELERGLYKFQDCAEREGGELLRRWQRCLAECIVRQMSAVDETDLMELTD